MAEVIFEELNDEAESTDPPPSQHQRPESSASTHTHIASPKPRRPSVDRDAQEMVIDSLRLQIQDLISQVSQLNAKLVKSYDRVSDLEDDLHVASSTIRSSSLKISQLELERTQHLSALNTGLLVEKQHVTAELNRLMEKATEEAAQRGQAESARIAIEKDLDDLSASLFGQANSMVAEARFEKHLSERKVEDAERALKSAEEAVKVMQAQMQAMQAEREEAEKKAREAEVAMGKGKWVGDAREVVASLRLLGTHAPYVDYLAFVAHLRVLHPASPHATPAMSTLLQLPFLVRLMTEDSEPTVRLDLAPSLNWLSRRSVLSAIHSGQLTIEPISASSLFVESSTYPSTSTTIAGLNSSGDNVSCALCGMPIFPTSTTSNSDSNYQHSRPPAYPHSLSQASQTWSGATAFFKKAGYPNGIPSSPTRRTSLGQHLTSNSNTQIFIFRLASPPIASLPIPSLTKSSSQSNSYPSNYNINGIPSSSSPSTSQISVASPNILNSNSTNTQPTTIYPLCQSGWCLSRLRTTCTLWAFVRAGIVDKVWEEDLPPPPPPPHHRPTSHAFHAQVPPEHLPASSLHTGEKPPVPPRKRGLWGIASAIGERAASWSGGPGTGEGEKSKKGASSATSQSQTQAETKAQIPSAPPQHPSLTAHATQEPRRLPPQLPPSNTTTTPSHPHPPPPPLPKRNEGRSRTPAPPPADPVSTQQESSTTTTTDNTHLHPTHPPHPSTHSIPPAISPRSHTRTPSSVPLPDSRPATPGSAPAPGVPSRATSPATVPATHGGAPPPPIPRRAAARARGVGGGAPQVSRPSTPANVATSGEKSPVAAEEKKDEKKKEGDAAAVSSSIQEDTTKEEKKEEEPTSAVLVAPPQASEATATTHADGETRTEIEALHVVPERSTEASPGGEDVFVDAPTPGPGQEAAAASAEEQSGERSAQGTANGREEEKEVVVDSPITVHEEGGQDGKPPVNGESHHHDEADGEYVHVNGVDREKEQNDSAVTSSVEENEEEERERREEELKEKEQKEKEQKEREKEKAAGFVGDATWEERTWKELVRLREDMFWARVGAFRELESEV